MDDDKTLGADEMNEEGFEVEQGSNVVLSDDDGTEVEFEYIGSVDYEGDEYVVLLPVHDEDDEDAEDEVLILKVESVEGEDDEEDEQYVSVESEDILNAVFEIFKNENSDMFEFIEE